jgi:hypothetical protein
VDDSVDVEAVENLTQEQELQGTRAREVDRVDDLSAISDEFDEEGYYDEDAMCDSISEGSEDGGVDAREEVEGDLTSNDGGSDDSSDDLSNDCWQILAQPPKVDDGARDA